MRPGGPGQRLEGEDLHTRLGVPGPAHGLQAGVQPPHVGHHLTALGPAGVEHHGPGLGLPRPDGVVAGVVEAAVNERPGSVGNLAGAHSHAVDGVGLGEVRRQLGRLELSVLEAGGDGRGEGETLEGTLGWQAV